MPERMQDLFHVVVLQALDRRTGKLSNELAFEAERAYCSFALGNLTYSRAYLVSPTVASKAMMLGHLAYTK